MLKRFWKEFADVQTEDSAAILQFCSPRRFLVMLSDGEYVEVGGPAREAETFEAFRHWHKDFTQNVAPAAQEVQRLLDKSRLSAKQRDRLRVLLNLLSAKSYRYCSFVSPLLPPISRDKWPVRQDVHLHYVPARPGVVGGSYWSAAFLDPQQIDAMTYENAEAATYLADLHTDPDMAEYLWAGTVTTVGHVFLDLIKDLEGGAILTCAACGEAFSGTGQQRRHANHRHEVFCRECSGIDESPQKYRAWLVSRHRKRKGMRR